MNWKRVHLCSGFSWPIYSWFGWSWIAGDHTALIRTSPLHGGWMWVAREWKVWTEMRRLCCLICGRWAIWFKLCLWCTPAGWHYFTVWVLGSFTTHNRTIGTSIIWVDAVWCAEVLNVLRLLQGFGFLPYLSTFQDSFKCRARDWWLVCFVSTFIFSHCKPCGVSVVSSQELQGPLLRCLDGRTDLLNPPQVEQQMALVREECSQKSYWHVLVNRRFWASMRPNKNRRRHQREMQLTLKAPFTSIFNKI